MVKPRLAALLVAFALSLAVVAACSEEDSSSSFFESAGKEDAATADAGPPRNFDPSMFDRSCAVDADCTLEGSVTFLGYASTKCALHCCNSVAVRNSAEMRESRDAVQRLCETFVVCTMSCGDQTAQCISGACAIARPGYPAESDGGGVDAGDAGDAGDVIR